MDFDHSLAAQSPQRLQLCAVKGCCVLPRTDA
jgi:hypothetical protein